MDVVLVFLNCEGSQFKGFGCHHRALCMLFIPLTTLSQKRNTWFPWILTVLWNAIAMVLHSCCLSRGLSFESVLHLELWLYHKDTNLQMSSRCYKRDLDQLQATHKHYTSRLQAWLYVYLHGRCYVWKELLDWKSKSNFSCSLESTSSPSLVLDAWRGGSLWVRISWC
jgi:hypothetical protein